MSRANVNRPYIDKVHPEVYKPMIQAAAASRKAGVEELKLDLLPTWREAEIFDDQERSALLLAETLTVIDKAADRDAIAAEAGEYLSADQISAVEWTVTLINAFNRISIASNHPVARPRTAES
ncbi:MAG: carboxymuconolactone decarboxylase family protein [Brevibacterium sp.]|uniref:Alkylhydroperoxidase AhpD family core domain-containing protein n=1 Tax=Brevibacterium antiquum CNRZ 918 TaxID=1255637 RepID=A0A2H1ICU6_9MICO|nr:MULTISPECIES: carboxymuconolactone decarboxylase family protein [Brevibacterium]MDN5808123.1 carboxymuconolactone decarboxylase family protein [Brevibacterium sp.]MDN5877892.1 carboxymuconolactone decarboxylase family protein [Brevibacterium sp.]MDN5910232.1 carboxymuconolactone decarboxylase family protein [Brevibacterium sp.]MDN6134596.1 carboxymuconolactone decarboxylase family protein [Brevibacterium sp.]MDN6158883.1 carboxymuconolactone decarboxylase family protein [Brevibacterium sp.]